MGDMKTRTSFFLLDLGNMHGTGPNYRRYADNLYNFCFLAFYLLTIEIVIILVN